jgi:hypothetical protein
MQESVNIFPGFGRGRNLPWMESHLILALIAFALLGCNKNINADANKAYLAVTNAAPGIPPIYIYFNGGPLGQDTSGVPLDSTTGIAGNHYLDAIAGIHTLKISSLANNTYVDGNTALGNGQYYSMFTYDTIPNGGLKVLILQDEFVAPPDTSSIVRVLNLSPDTTLYDLILTNAVDTFSFPYIPYVGTSPNPGYLSPFGYYITQGSYGVVAYLDSLSPVKVLDSLNFTGGSIYSLYYTTGLVGTNPDSLTIHLLQHN